jgi:hypothetical protein
MATSYFRQQPALQRRNLNLGSGLSAPASSPQPQLGQGAQKQGRRYLNIRDYLAVNKDRAQQAAGQVGARLESQAQGAAAAQDSARAQFSAGRNADGSRQQQGAVQRTTGLGSGLSTPVADLTQTQSYADASAKTDANQRDLGLGNTDLARQQWGQDAAYSSNSQAMDALYLGQGNERLQQLREKYSGLSDLWSRSHQDAEAMGRADRAAMKAPTAAAAPLPPSTAPTQGEINAKQRGDQTRTIADETWLQQQGGSLWQDWMKAGSPDLGAWLEQKNPALAKKYRGG